MSQKLVLYSFYRSSCAWRVRIALALKGIEYECRTINLLKGEQHDDEFHKQNPQRYVPALLVNNNNSNNSNDNTSDQRILTQSVAIMEYLDEAFPSTHPLLPRECPLARADVRRLSLMIAADIQPIQNLSVLKCVSDDTILQNDWGRWVVEKGLDAVESRLGESAGMYCVGNSVTMADVCLVPQIFNAVRFGVDLRAYPLVCGVHERLIDLEAFEVAHPSAQPDCPRKEVPRLFRRIRDME